MKTNTKSDHSQKLRTYTTKELPATQYFRLKGDYATGEFHLRRGGRLPQVTLAYETWGNLSYNRDNVVLLFGGLSASAHACSSPKDPTHGWWEHMIGPNAPLDTKRFHIICVNSLGSCFGSTSPSSSTPEDGKPYATRFPALTIEDIAKAAHHLIHDLGTDHLLAVVGGSLGGMSALAYTLQYPKEVDALVCLSAATQATPAGIAIRSLQREIITNDPQWEKGHYYPGKGPQQGMVLARKLGMISYRAAEEWETRFSRERISVTNTKAPFGIEFQIESYLDYNARKFVAGFDANSYLYLSRALDWFNAAAHGGTTKAALSKIQVEKALIAGVKSDKLFPISQQREVAQGLQNTTTQVSFHELPSIHGHDSFLIADRHFIPIIRDFFNSLR